MLKSWQAKTDKSYDLLFEMWYSWCFERGVDPISGPITNALNFVAHLHLKGYQYCSLNSYRSAISEHPLVSRFNERSLQ